MPIQRLSLFGALPARHLEAFVHVVQQITSESVLQFKTLTRVYKDESAPQGRRASDFLRIQHNALLSEEPSGSTTAVIEVIDAPEISKRPVTSRIVHVVPCTTGDPAALAKSMGYTESFAFFEQGYQVSIGVVQVRIYQIFRAERPSDAAMDSDTPDRAAEPDVVAASREALQGLVIGQGSTWIVQTDVQAKTGAPDDLRRGTDDLLRLRREFAGYLDLMPLMDELR